MRRGGPLQALGRCWTPAASTSASSPTSRTWTSRFACGWRAGAAATSPWSRATRARARRCGSRTRCTSGWSATRCCCSPRPSRARWLPWIAYRQLGWAWHAQRDGRLGAHLRGALAALPLLPVDAARAAGAAAGAHGCRSTRWSRLARSAGRGRAVTAPGTRRRASAHAVRELLGPLRRRRAAAARLRRGARRRVRRGLPRGPAGGQGRVGRAAGGPAARAPARAARLARARRRRGGAAARRPRRARRAGSCATCSPAWCWPGACARRSHWARSAARAARALRARSSSTTTCSPGPPWGAWCGPRPPASTAWWPSPAPWRAISTPRGRWERVCGSATPEWTWGASPPSHAPESPGQALLLGAIVDWKRPDLALEAAGHRRPRAARAAAAGGRARRSTSAARSCSAASASEPGGPTSRGAWSSAGPPTPPRRCATRPASSTARTASRSAWSCSRRSPRRGPWSPPPRGGPAELLDDARGQALPARRRPRPPPPGSSRCWATPASRTGSGRRAGAAPKPGTGSRARASAGARP